MRTPTPDPDIDCRGVIGRTRAESTPWAPAPPRAPVGAPSIVVIVLDDVGFADLGCYGSEIEGRPYARFRRRGARPMLRTTENGLYVA